MRSGQMAIPDGSHFGSLPRSAARSGDLDEEEALRTLASCRRGTYRRGTSKAVCAFFAAIDLGTESLDADLVSVGLSSVVDRSVDFPEH